MLILQVLAADRASSRWAAGLARAQNMPKVVYFEASVRRTDAETHGGTLKFEQTPCSTGMTP